eukprot:scaffold18082_cov60-Isochrysis_galbana.AAC.1
MASTSAGGSEGGRDAARLMDVMHSKPMASTKRAIPAGGGEAGPADPGGWTAGARLSASAVSVGACSPTASGWRRPRPCPPYPRTQLASPARKTTGSPQARRRRPGNPPPRPPRCGNEPPPSPQSPPPRPSELASPPPHPPAGALQRPGLSAAPGWQPRAPPPPPPRLAAAGRWGGRRIDESGASRARGWRARGGKGGVLRENRGVPGVEEGEGLSKKRRRVAR